MRHVAAQSKFNCRTIQHLLFLKQMQGIIIRKTDNPLRSKNIGIAHNITLYFSLRLKVTKIIRPGQFQSHHKIGD